MYLPRVTVCVRCQSEIELPRCHSDIDPPCGAAQLRQSALPTLSTEKPHLAPTPHAVCTGKERHRSDGTAAQSVCLCDVHDMLCCVCSKLHRNLLEISWCVVVLRVRVLGAHHLMQGGIQHPLFLRISSGTPKANTDPEPQSSSKDVSSDSTSVIVWGSMTVSR